jgi:hypothetical protein
LLISRYGGSALDSTESMNGSSYWEIAYTLNTSRCIFFSFSTTSSTFDRNSGESNADSPDITAKNITAVESLACTNGVVESLEVDWWADNNVNNEPRSMLTGLATHRSHSFCESEL